MAINPRVLIIDQDLHARAELLKMLALSRFAVVGEAGYGVEAISIAGEVKPDLVLVRIEEPVARPLQTIEAITSVVPEAPIIAYSSLGDAASIRRAMLAGVQDYLPFPLNQDEVTRSARDAMDRTESKKQRASGSLVEQSIGGTIITVFGAKGGIGKTTLATNLSMALARESGQSVALIDMDTRFGDVAIMMDLPAVGGITELVRNGQPPDRDSLRRAMTRHASGVYILPAPRHPSEWESIGPHHIRAIVGELAKSFDYVVLDTPGTFNDLVEEALRIATLVLLLTSVDMASIKDTVLALDMLRSWSFPEEKIKLAVNHANSANSINEDDIQKALDYTVYWKIPFDKAVGSSTQLGQPVVLADPQSRVSQSIIGLARSLSGRTAAPDAAQRSKFLGLFGRAR